MFKIFNDINDRIKTNIDKKTNFEYKLFNEYT